MPDVDPDLVKKVVEHHYFQHLVKDECHNRCREYWSRKWTVLVTVVGTILTIGGYLGVEKYTDLQRRATDLEKQAKDVQMFADSMKLWKRGMSQP